jgi:hypothetical protein
MTLEDWALVDGSLVHPRCPCWPSAPRYSLSSRGEVTPAITSFSRLFAGGESQLVAGAAMAGATDRGTPTLPWPSTMRVHVPRRQAGHHHTAIRGAVRLPT